MNARRSHRRHAPLLAIAAVLLLAAFLVVACGGESPGTSTTTGPATTSGPDTTAAPGTTGSSTPTGGQTTQVNMVNISFDPEEVTVKVGDTVTWVNQDPQEHDVIAENGEFASELFGKDGTFSFTFTTAGTFPYYCSVHPSMTGTVIVE